MQVVLEIRSLKPTEVRRHIRLPPVAPQPLERPLDLTPAARRLVLSYEAVALLEVLPHPAVQVDGKALVVGRYLRAEVATARMDDQVVGAVLCAVNLNEVVAAAQRADAALDAARVLELAEARQLREVKARAAHIPHGKAAWHRMAGSVERDKVEVVLGQPSVKGVSHMVRICSMASSSIWVAKHLAVAYLP